jgi:GAF domain-containing protein
MQERSSWRRSEKDAFQAAVHGAPLETSLGFLTRAAIRRSNRGARCAFYISNAERTKLYHVTGMPHDYARAVNGFEIGPNSLACGLAAYTGQAVITPDVNEDARWLHWRAMAAQFGYRSCWSFPLASYEGEVVGTFAMYHCEPFEIADKHLELVDDLGRAASIIIRKSAEKAERSPISDALRDSAEQLQAFRQRQSPTPSLRSLLPVDRPKGISEAGWSRLREDYEAAMTEYTAATIVIGRCMQRSVGPTGAQFRREKEALAKLAAARRAFWAAWRNG